MSTEGEVLSILDEVLGLDGRSSEFETTTGLLGSLPEFDSMAVVGIITTIEERFDVFIDDDEIDASVFETVGSLVGFVDGRL